MQRVLNKKSIDRPTFVPVHPSLTPWTSALINQVADRARRLFDYYLTSVGIHTNHYVILFILAHQGPHSQSELARFLQVDRSLMVQLIDQLEQRQWVERAPNPHDRRAYAVTLTATGQTFLDQATECVRSVEADLLAPLAPVEREQLRQLLARMLA